MQATMNLEQIPPLKISVVIPVYNAIATLMRCLEAVISSSYPDYECLVVDDGSLDGSQDVTHNFPVRFYQLNDGPHGPAFARNFGAEKASGDILLFIDADVVIYPDTLSIIADQFVHSPEYDAMFGAYDDSPADGGFVSQYKNLTHHFVHQQANPEAGTFWSGCGAIRRNVFLEAGGFDAKRYHLPSIEDIELGARLKSGGHRIAVNKAVKVKHLKRWTIKGLVKTDVFDRAIPWTLLIMQARNLPNDLNLKISQRLSAVLTFSLLFFLGWHINQLNVILFLTGVILFLIIVGRWDWSAASNHRPDYSSTASSVSSKPARLAKIAFSTLITLSLSVAVFGLVRAPPSFSIPVLGILTVLIGLNFKLYFFYVRTRGIIFALAALVFQLFYYFYSVLAFLFAALIHYRRKFLKSKNTRFKAQLPS